MSKLKKYVKLANDLDNLGHHKEAKMVDNIITANHRCNCENEACEKLGEHTAAGCKKPAGQFKALYIGSVCDDCAENLPAEYLIGFKNYPMPERVAALDLTMEKEVEVSEDGDEIEADEDDGEKTTKKKKITLSFD